MVPAPLKDRVADPIVSKSGIVVYGSTSPFAALNEV